MEPYFNHYIQLVNQNPLELVLKERINNDYKFFENLTPTIWGYQYAPNKWTVKQVLQHCIDSERIFATRSLRIARKDVELITPFNENEFAENAPVNHRKSIHLLAEFHTQLISTQQLYNSFTPEVLDQKGNLPAGEIQLKNLGYLIAGHTQHHINIIKERYL